MSGFVVKTTYKTEGAYGSTEDNILYAKHNNSSDYVTFYDEDGDYMFTVPDTIDNNLFDAIKRLYSPISKNELIENVEYVKLDEYKPLGI